MLTGGWLYVVALVASFAIATIATPVGVSGAVLLLPFQVGVLGTPSPTVTPTNLLYNVVATPGALYRYRRQHQTGGRLTAVLLIGTVPGVIAGSIIRVLLLPGDRVFEVVIAAVLIPLSGWLLLSRQSPTGAGPQAGPLSGPLLAAIAAGVGCVGGIYGIGGGSILAPLLIGSGRSPSEVAPATLTATLVTSVAGVATFLVLSTSHHGSVAPDWGVGVALGTGGVLGSYTGARLQPHLPELVIRRLLALLVLAVGVRYAWLAAPLTQPVRELMGRDSVTRMAVHPSPGSSNTRRPAGAEPHLTMREWAVLGAVAERPTHGYAVAQLLAPEGALGQIWTLTRPDVYQSIKKLIKVGLISERSTEPGSGPDRTVLAVTPRGRRVVARWLKESVEHVRDGRTVLLLKLMLLDRADADIGPLIEAQRARFEPIVEALEAQCRRANGVELMVLQWRLESSRAALDFLRQVTDCRRQPEA